ncbi:unnamed protein product [Symbiodinium sp. CCMP2592]|nr:unnamed protein product [Symbiodinium sp. CCMP2592]
MPQRRGKPESTPDDEQGDGDEQGDHHEENDDTNMMQTRLGGSASSSDPPAHVVPEGCLAMAMVRCLLRRIAAILAESPELHLEQAVESVLLLLDPHSQGGEANVLWREHKKRRVSNEFLEVEEQLRRMARRLPSELNDEDLATDLSVGIATLYQDLSTLLRATADQAGLQVTEAVEGTRTAIKAISLTQEAAGLALELLYVPPAVHASNVVALEDGGEEQTGGLPPLTRLKYYLKELGALLPFLTTNEGEPTRKLLGQLLQWLQGQERSTLMIDSQGNAETQETDALPSLFGGSLEPVDSAAGNLGDAPAATPQSLPTTANGEPADTLQLDNHSDGENPSRGMDSQEHVPTQPVFWGLRREMAELDVPSSAERDAETEGEPSHDSGPPATEVAESHYLRERRVSDRRLARIARDWGLEFYIAKLGIRKAFDSIYQESLAAHVHQAIGEKAKLSWEARAWVAVLHAQNLCIQVPGESIPTRQSNGVRQGAPESPVAFGSVVAEGLDAAIREAKSSKPADETSPPQDGGSYMDDNYIWSTCRKHFQHMLSCLDQRLPRRGLFLHPGKTDMISNSEKKVTFKVAGEDVATKGPKHVFHVLGSPLSFQGGTAMLLAEAQSRARKVFWTDGESFTSAATMQKLQIHVVLVRQSALWACQTWPCHSSLLRSINTIQLAQVRVMLGLRRQPCEEWATWNKRSLRRSRLALYHCGGTRWSTFVLSQIWTAIGHVSRGDPIGGKILQWHSLQWWQEQKDRGRQLQHASRFNAYMDIDRQLSDTIGKNWFAIAQDRETWGEWEAAFIAKYDVPWSSGKQNSIANLAPGDQQAADRAFIESITDGKRGGKHPQQPEAEAATTTATNPNQQHATTTARVPDGAFSQAKHRVQQSTTPQIKPMTGDKGRHRCRSTLPRGHGTIPGEAATSTAGGPAHSRPYKPTGPATASSSSTDIHHSNSSTTPTHKPTTPAKPHQPYKPTAEEQWQYDNAPQGPAHEELEIPSSIPHAEGTTVTYLPLSHGCFEVEITATHYIPTAQTASAGLPPLHIAHPGQSGPVLTAPPFTVGLAGRLAPMGPPDVWLFMVTSTPPLDDFWPASLLVADGDTFIIELTPNGWRMTIDKQAEQPPPETVPHSSTDNHAIDPPEPPPTHNITLTATDHIEHYLTRALADLLVDDQTEAEVLRTLSFLNYLYLQMPLQYKIMPGDTAMPWTNSWDEPVEVNQMYHRHILHRGNHTQQHQPVAAEEARPRHVYTELEQWQYDNAPQGPDDLEPPPGIPHAEGTTVTYNQLTNGCWEAVISAELYIETPLAFSPGLPPLHMVHVGQRGPVIGAPPLPPGTIARLAPMGAPDTWLLIITSLPMLDEFWPQSMFVVEGAGMHNTASVLRQMGGALQGIQMEPSNREYWLQLVDVTSYLVAVEAGETVAHPADVIAANRGILQSNLALREQLDESPGEDLNSVHAALLDSFEAYLKAGDTLEKGPGHAGGLPEQQPAPHKRWLHGGYAKNTMGLAMWQRRLVHPQNTTTATKALQNIVEDVYTAPL